MTRVPAVAALVIVIAVALWAHLASGVPVFDAQVSPEPGWQRFRARYAISHFGEDGQFVRSVQNGYNLFFHTHKYAARFTRRTARDSLNACSACHTVEDLAYSFVNSDRFDSRIGKRLSFEDRVRWCYATSVDGFVPTVFDPTVRDIRLLARAVAHHLQLGEGALRTEED